MENWIECNHIREFIIPEINRIWSKALIKFELVGCRSEYIYPDGNQKGWIEFIEESKRGDPGRGSVIFDLVESVGVQRHDAMNVYLIPFMGSTNQGLARLGGKKLVVGVWTDKPSKGRDPPKKTPLVEPPPMNTGSLGRTIAHELGHNLNLEHPTDSTRDQPRLMGGKFQGYNLSPQEISKSRQHAKKIITNIKESKIPLPT